MQKTWKPTTAGILSIVSGAVGLLLGIGLAVGLGMLGPTTGIIPGALGGALIGIPGIIIGIVAIVGGIYALRRRVWGLALAGAICAFLVPLTFILGILAIIFVAMGKREFE